MSKTLLLAMLLGPCLVAQSDNQDTSANRAVRTPTTSTYVPMTQKQRLGTYFEHMFTVESVFRAAAGAAINQGLNTPAEWRQGSQGYGRRFESVYGGHIVQSTIMYAGGAILHEDNRYFRSGLQGFGPRFKYALASAFLARHDDGSRHFSISRITSYAATAAISREWQPPSTSHLDDAGDAFGVAIGVEMGFNVAREFVPRLFHTEPPLADR